MGAAGALAAVGLGMGSIGSAIGAVQRANSEITASKSRARFAKTAAAEKGERIRREGADLLARQRTKIGRSRIQRTESALQILVANAGAIEQEASATLYEGLNIAKMEDVRRTEIRKTRDVALALSFLMPGGAPGGFALLGQVVSGERFDREATFARKLSEAQSPGVTRIGSGGARLGTAPGRTR